MKEIVSDKTALVLLKWAEAFIDFIPILPVIVLLYSGRGVSVGEFFMIQGLFRLTAFLFEIPSGYLADIFSRRKMLLIGSAVHLAAMVWLLFAQGFWGILLAEAAMGLAFALFSGTKEAYTYDLLKRMGREKDYLKENGSIQTFAQISTLVAVLLGGVLFAMGEYWLLGIEAFVAFLALIGFAFLPELVEVRRKVAPESSPLKDCLSIVKMSVKHPEIKWLMIFPAVYSGFTLIMFWILQPVMEVAMVPVILFGFFVGLNQGVRAVFFKIAYRIKKFLGVRTLLLMSIFALMIGFGSAIAAVYAAPNMVLVYVLVAIVAIMPAVQSICGLVFKDYIHHKIKSTERGTVLSVNSMFNMGATGLMMVMAKPLLDNLGIVATLLICLVAVVFMMLPLQKVLGIKNIDSD